MITKSIKDRIREHFFVNPSVKLRVRQIERELKLPLPSVIRYCKELEEERILQRVETGGIILYTSDRNSVTYLLEKKLFNIKSIFDSGLIDYLAIEYSNPAIVIFGSYSRGEDIENSDIDIYIETAKKHTFNLNKFEKILNRKIQVFNYKSVKEISNIHLANNIINGLTLNGFLEVFK